MGSCCCKHRKKTPMKSNNPVIKDGKTEYSILTLIGEGYYGSVYKGLKNNKMPCAIKKISREQFKERECHALEIVKLHPHKNLMDLICVIPTKPTIYIISSIYTGSDLFNKITDDTLTESEAFNIMRQLLSAIKHIHEIGIVHRDIKPENIIVDDNNNIKLLDFGLAKVCPEIIYYKNHSRRWSRLGTPYYMSPEVLNEHYSELCDEWSAGIIYYIIITSYPPYNGETDDSILQNIRTEPVYYDHTLWDTINATTKMIVHNLLNRNCAKRKSAAYLLDTYTHLKD